MAKADYEFRYYQIPAGDYVMALLGKGWEINYGNDLPDGQLHFHNYMEIGYCYHGRGKLVIGDRTYRYGNDMFTVIPENIPHTTVSDADSICKWEFLYIDTDSFIRYEMKDYRIDASTLIRMVNRRGTLKSRQHHPMMANLVRAIIEECRNRKPYYREVLKGYVRALIFGILRLDEEREQLKSQTNQSSVYILKGIRYIEDHFPDDIHVADIAGFCGLSESHFRRTFESVTGMKPVDYLNMVRVTKACEMMEKENVTIAEVSRRAGFVTASSFNRNFKALTGVTPSTWKKDSGNGRSSVGMKVNAKPGWLPSEWSDRYRSIWEEMEAGESSEAFHETMSNGAIGPDVEKRL